MSDAFVVSGKPSWTRFADFQGATPAEEREAIRIDNIKGKNFKRGRKNPLRDATSADLNAGQWGQSRHRCLR